jgi:coproporphyrinogen III oxidase
MQKEEIASWFQGLQDRICASLERADGKARFEEDLWERPGGGGGRTRIIRNGAILEKGGVAFSAVHGKTPEKILGALGLQEADFYATGVSIVLHPQNPMVPIIHMNVRYFEMSNGVWWFGGGIDLTPHYVNAEDGRYFHTQLKAVCDQHHASYYPEFKKWADDYFYIKHRQETRGIGGIFFDRLSNEGTFTKEGRFQFVQSVGELFAPLYTYFMSRNSQLSFGENEKEWQMVRRGRYVEYNLVYDKGTKFGLDTDGRTESILMSMPPQARWHYNYQVQPGSPEEQTLTYLKKGIEWTK